MSSGADESTASSAERPFASGAGDASGSAVGQASSSTAGQASPSSVDEPSASSAERPSASADGCASRSAGGQPPASSADEPLTSNADEPPSPAAGEPSASSAGQASVYGPRTLPVSLATALLCAVLALVTDARPELAVWLLLTPLGVLLALVDLRVRRLPDVLTLPLAAAALGLLGAVAAVPEHTGNWQTALWGTLALGGGYYVLWRINPGGMGFGDVKLALAAGAVLGWYGWDTVLLGTFAGFLFGALWGGVLVLTGKAGRRTAIPFGPFLIAGAYAGLLMGAYAA
ncbi:prepilin peptidase [Streptomyces sp. NPDC019531]|uniref:prepilin peptidase n=1 Tax=Streptomyces sp. NPDC019531 TaxID=3365062 RepID=UPI00384F3568